MVEDSPLSGPLASLNLSLSNTVDGLYGHERGARLRRTRSGFLAVFEIDDPLPDVRIGGFNETILNAFVFHKLYIVRIGSFSMAKLKTGHRCCRNRPPGVETGQHPNPEKNILRTENK
jgi:hypothetical protein